MTKLPGSSTPPPAAEEAVNNDLQTVADTGDVTVESPAAEQSEIEKSFESMADEMLSNDNEGDEETPPAEEQAASEEPAGEVREEPEKPVEVPKEEIAAEATGDKEPEPQEAAVEPEAAAPVEEPTEPKIEEVAQQEFTQEQVDTDRKKMVDSWTERYAMSEDEGTEMLANPHEELPKFAARLHTQVVEDSLQMLAQILPQMMKQVNDADRAKDAFNNAFYKAWPKLNNDKCKPTIRRITDLYVKENTGATTEQIIQEVGASAMIAFKIPPDDMVPAGSVEAAASQGGASFTPAQPGGGTTPVVVKPITNDFERMSIEFEKDDAG